MKFSSPLFLGLASIAKALPAQQYPTLTGPPGYEDVDTLCSSLDCKQNAVNFAYMVVTPPRIFFSSTLTDCCSMDFHYIPMDKFSLLRM